MNTIGKIGEDACARYLKRRGYSIVERNWRFGRAGELDIIAVKKDIIHFVEVKSRRATNSTFSGIESVDFRKRQKIIWLAEQYFIKHEEKLLSLGISGSSFDIAIVRVQSSLFRKTHIFMLKSAFESE